MAVARWALTVEVPAEEVWSGFETELQKLQKETVLPGFRRGKVPLSILRQKFGKAVEADILHQRLGEFYGKALAEAGIGEAVSPPEISLIQAEMHESLIFKATVETEPPAELAAYEGLTVVRERVSVGDEAVDKHIERLRERQAVIHDDPSPAGAESLLEVDLQELDSARLPVIGHKREGVLIDLSRSSPELRDSLVGIKASESRNVSILKPSASPQEEKKYEHFQVNVKAVKRVELPELNDDFAKSVDAGLQDMKDLRQAVRRLLQDEVDGLSYQRVSHLLVHQVVDNTRLDVPEGMLKDYIDRLVEDARKKVQARGEQFDEGLYRDRLRGSAVWNLKWYLTRKKIAAKEGLTVREEDLESEYERMAVASKKDIKQIKAMFAEGRRRDQLEDDLLERKVLQHLMSKARVIDRTVSYEEFFAEEEANREH